jgi:hypothetical protein
MHDRARRTTGEYVLQHAETILAGARTVTLVPDVLYRVGDAAIASLPGAEVAAFFFLLGPDGDVKAVVQRSGARAVDAVGTGTTLRFSR